MIVALCPTYKRPHLMGNVIAMWQRQICEAPRHLLILDDAPSFAHDLKGDNWTLRTRAERYPFLGAKFAAMTQMAIDEFGARYVVLFQDDDVYFPHYLQHHLDVLTSGADLSIPSRVCTNYPLGKGKSIAQDNKLMHHGAWGFSAAIYAASKGYPQDRTEQFNMILRDHLLGAGAKTGDCYRAVPQYLYRWFTASRNGSGFGKNIMASQDDNPMPDKLLTAVDIALDDETQIFYAAAGYGDESWRLTGSAQAPRAAESPPKTELVAPHTLSAGYRFEKGYAAFVRHREALEQLYKSLGTHLQQLTKVWIYTGNIVVFEFTLHQYPIAFDIKFASDTLVVDVMERSKRLICAYEGARLNFSKASKVQLLQMTAGQSVMYPTIVLLINRFLSAVDSSLARASEVTPFVISMRPAFWDRIEKQLADWPNPPVLWAATDGRQLDLDVYIQAGQLDLAFRQAQGQVPLTRGEMGCYQSHLRLWQHVADTQVPVAAIFEDDADITPDLTEWVSVAMQYLGQWDLVYLGFNWMPLSDSIPGVSEFVLPRIAEQYHVLIGYLITPAGARKLIDSALPMQIPVDCYVASQIKSGLVSWQAKASQVSPVAGTYSSTQGIR